MKEKGSGVPIKHFVPSFVSTPSIGLPPCAATPSKPFTKRLCVRIKVVLQIPLSCVHPAVREPCCFRVASVLLPCCLRVASVLPPCRLRIGSDLAPSFLRFCWPPGYFRFLIFSTRVVYAAPR
ncbi:hypothetical protein BKA66DRAFT_62355 [Pyrenochaeta sp. MPI-SDFR-AT-0127]|nr:hypothetical protein BKA66DRAFT_62355 [Pyrenochaeta sp. MPI-SDFR-AT-0127]